MSAGFVVLLRSGPVPDDHSQVFPGSGAVRVLADIGACTEPDDRPAVLIDALPELSDASELGERVKAVLATFATLAGSSATSGPDVVVTDVQPMTDTLKQVDAEGTVTGTADRERHRLVRTPLAARIGLVRTARAHRPQAATAGEILASLAESGATVVAVGG